MERRPIPASASASVSAAADGDGEGGARVREGGVHVRGVRVRSDHAVVASAAVGAVVLWMLVRRRTPSRLDAGEFAACVLVLAMAAGYVGTSSSSSLVEEVRGLGVAARAWWGAALERFAPEDGGGGSTPVVDDGERAAALDDARVALDDARVAVDDATTRTALESARDTLMGSLGRVVTLLHRGNPNPRLSGSGGDGDGDDEAAGDEVVLDADVYPEPVRREYRMISAWWCQMRATAPRAHAALMAASRSLVGGTPASRPLPRPRPLPPRPLLDASEEHSEEQDQGA